MASCQAESSLVVIKTHQFFPDGLTMAFGALALGELSTVGIVIRVTVEARCSQTKEGTVQRSVFALEGQHVL